MFSRKMKYLLNYFDVCGFNSGLSKLSRSRKAIYITNTMHILMVIFVSFYQFRWMMKYFLSVQSLEVVNYLLQYLATLYTYCFIMLDSNLQMRKHRQFWRVFKQIDEFYHQQNGLNITSYLSKFLLCFFISSFVILIVIVTTENLSDIEALFVYLFLIKVSEARVFHYLLCLEVLKFQLKTIENSLINRPSDIRQFKWMRGHYHYIYEMVNCLNSIFGLSQVAIILFCFYFFLTDVNFIYVSLYTVEQTALRIMSKSNSIYLKNSN